MTKTQIIVLVGVLSVSLAGGSGAYYLNYSHAKSAKLAAAKLRVTSSDNVPISPATVGSSSISLNQNFDTPEANGLAVSTAQNNSASLQSSGSQQTLGQSTSSSNGMGSAAQSDPFDPTTFAQYEKYKDDKGGLFAEVQPGTGASLEPNKKAAVFYRGWLTNGTKFDESRPGADGKLTPFIFTLGAHAVIPGWEQTLAGMKVGAVRLLIIPPSVGYGTTGQNGIPPNSVLVFQVQLADVQ